MVSKNIITITSTALKKLQTIVKTSDSKALRFYVKGGGCSGFNYKLEPTNSKPDKSDEVVKCENFEIYVCGKSLMHLLGTQIDWKEDIMGQGFAFDNPMAGAKCGCGTSFSSKAFM